MGLQKAVGGISAELVMKLREKINSGVRVMDCKKVWHYCPSTCVTLEGKVGREKREGGEGEAGSAGTLLSHNTTNTSLKTEEYACCEAVLSFLLCILYGMQYSPHECPRAFCINARAHGRVGCTVYLLDIVDILI